MTILITAGAYVSDELRNEFGYLPPCFLPVGNRPLLFWQLRLLKASRPGEPILLSLPENYTVEPFHEEFLEGVEIVRVPTSLSLAQSLMYVLNVSGSSSGEITILHGDTLVEHIPRHSDFIGIAQSSDGYDWDEVSDRCDGKVDVWCGVFSFSDGTELVRSLALAGDDFRTAVGNYESTKGIRYEHFEVWWDCGHLNTYLRAKTNVTTERAFNELLISDGTVHKRSSKTEKIKRESYWFERLPTHLKPFTPALYDVHEDTGEYSIEYLPMMSVSDIFVFGNQDYTFWNHILGLYQQWFMKARMSATEDTNRTAEKTRRELVVEKTWSRVRSLQHDWGLDVDAALKFNGNTLPSLRRICEILIADALRRPLLPGVLHGDLCFSNCLIDTRNDRLRVLDPRGASVDAGLTGDMTYDVAKIIHSAIGQYDLIIAGAFDLKSSHDGTDFNFEVLTGPTQEIASQTFWEHSPIPGDGNAVRNALPTMLLLFLTMPPLHSDNPLRQRALFANGLRLFDSFYMPKNKKEGQK